MLKTVSSIANAIGAVNYKGTWNANTNTPALASGVGSKGDYYVVSVSGTTTLDGISLWGVGDWAVFNGTAWQRVDGGTEGNFTSITSSGDATISGATKSLGGSVTIAAGATATLFTPASGSAHIVSACADNGDANTSGACFVTSRYGASLPVLNSLGTSGLTFSASGGALQLTNNTAFQYTYNWNALKLL